MVEAVLLAEVADRQLHHVIRDSVPAAVGTKPEFVEEQFNANVPAPRPSHDGGASSGRVPRGRRHAGE